MSIKSFIFLFFVITLANQCWSKDSFIVRSFEGYRENELVKVVYFAEQARIRHGSGNKKMIGYEIRENLNKEWGKQHHCMVSEYGNANIYVYYQQWIFDLKSETNDNLVIICWCMTRQGKAADEPLRLYDASTV